MGISERADDDLAHPIGHGKGRNHRRGRADRDAELSGDLRQQRVAHAQVGGADERCQREQQNGA